MLVFSLKELEELGYKEVRPNVFARVNKPAKVPEDTPSKTGRCKAVKAIVGGKKCRFRSYWEYVYALSLQLKKLGGHILDWKFEPRRFDFPIKRGNNSYLPDFQVIEKDGSHYWVEVKGYMSPAGAVKLKRFAKFYPEERIVLVREEEINALKKLNLDKNKMLI